MDSTSDPLLALRHAIKSKTPITYLTHGQPAPTLLAATHLSLNPSLTLLKSSPTRYTKPGISNPSSPADVYTLEAVYLAWLLRDAPGAEYMRQARESGLTVGFVSVTERKSVVEWLEGKVADLERIRPLASGECVHRFAMHTLTFGLRVRFRFVLWIESTTPPGTPPRRATGAAPSATPKHASHSHVADATSPKKRLYVADAQDMEVVKRIKQNEVELRDRNTVLRGTKPNVGLVSHPFFFFPLVS